jgi:uncharacterized RDD family membrane protein YckC
MADWVAASTIDDFRGIWGKGFGPRAASAATPPPVPPGSTAPARRTRRILDDDEMPEPGRLRDHAGGDAPQVRPWVRFWARGLDNSLLVLAAVLVFSTLGPFNLMSFAALCIGALFAYPFQLWIFGTTIGKAIFGISVETPEGMRPSYAQASARELGVYLKGLALGVPLVSLFTLIASYKRLTSDGTTSWDRAGGLVVRHQRVGVLRWGAWLVVYVGITGWTFALANPARMAQLNALAHPKSSMASISVTRTDPEPSTPPFTAPKPRHKPKLLTLPSSDKPTSQPAIKPKRPATRPAKPQNRPPPSVVFKPEPTPEN